MNDEIAILFEEHNKNYLEKVSKFEFNYDSIAMFTFEYSYYFKPLVKNLVPLLAKELGNKDNEIDYLSYVDERFHDRLVQEILKYKKYDDYRKNKIKN